MRHCAAARRGLSMIEVLVGLGILMAGILALLTIFPQTLRAQNEAELITIGSTLAQMKAEEIRRDNDRDGRLIDAIRQLDEPTDPIVFQTDPRLSYSFSGRTLYYDGLDSSDPRAAEGVARVIIRYAPGFRPTQDVIYELRFN